MTSAGGVSVPPACEERRDQTTRAGVRVTCIHRHIEEPPDFTAILDELVRSSALVRRVLLVALFIPFIHLFVSTSRMAREAAGTGLPMPEFPAR